MTSVGGLHNRDTPPYAPQRNSEIGDVLKRMNEHTSKKGPGGFKCKKKKYDVGDKSGRTVESWQMMDWEYKKQHLPTYARGLFTHHNNGKPEIAVRGYDKFFNINETRSTEWRNIEQHTRGPYELSVKENGCIIFIAGLDDDTLVTTSKHSMGPRQDNEANHALAGEQWLDKQLSVLGKTRADLAKRLRSMNATAVAELCDDNFEEHVLAYTPENAGLYLHGINLNLPEFATYSGNLVHDFADEWGFRKVMYVVEDDIHTVKTFLDQVAETGNYAGRDTEGFVIRCQKREGPNGLWHDWFFKYKFDEPYLMYRQWREATKAVIAGKPPKYRKHKKITDEYLIYARRQLAKNPGLGQKYNKNHGIIAMRDGFLAEKGVKGSDIIRGEMSNGNEGSSVVTHDVVLVPIATIGCGKTTVAYALTKLFAWGHEQNDNITGTKDRPRRFTSACTTSLTQHPVLIADRNNHQRREREQIIRDIKHLIPEAHFVALHYVHDRGNLEEIRTGLQERVLSRGDNHQTIHAGTDRQKFIGVMEGFLHRFEPLDMDREPDRNFDLTINLDPLADSSDNLKTVVYRLHEEFPKLFTMPTEEQMDKAIESTFSDYTVDVKHDLGGKQATKQQKRAEAKQNAKQSALAHRSAKPSKLEYLCISLPAERINAILDAVFASEKADVARFYNQLKAMKRVQPGFHVTLIHRASATEHSDYWKGMSSLWTRKQSEAKSLQSAPNGDASHTANTAANDDPASVTDPIKDLELGTARVQLERVVWDDRVMAILARLPDVKNNGFKTVNNMAHITVGTAADNIKPRESNDLLEAWEKGDENGKIQDIRVKGSVILDGSVKGVLSR